MCLLNEITASTWEPVTRNKLGQSNPVLVELLDGVKEIVDKP